jgi:hypothetical protein
LLRWRQMVFEMSPTNSIFSFNTWNSQTREMWSCLFCIVCVFPGSHVLATTKVLTQVRLCLQLKSCRKSICRDVAIPATAQVASNGNVLFTLPLLATFFWTTTLSSEKRTRCGSVPRRRERGGGLRRSRADGPGRPRGLAACLLPGML